jgi:NitT/TauT family transport system substrate-binding protein
MKEKNKLEFLKNKAREQKKAVVSLALFFLVVVLSVLVTGCEKKESNLKKVTLNEVAHSIFYAPQYVAIENGYFEEEGIDLTLVTGFGADKVMSALVAGEADIGFAGAEASVYLYSEGASDYAVNFAQLTQRAGNFLVSREPIEDFTWDMLKGKDVLGGRRGGMPEMVFEYILKKNGLDPSTDLQIDQSIDFGSTAAAFSGGQGDFTVEFEPSATALEQAGEGYVVASLGVESGYVPYTAYCTTKDYLEENEDVVESFTKALQKGMEYVNSHTPQEIAEVIAPQFEETELETIETIVARYYDQETWKDNLIFEESSFDLLQNILMDAGELSNTVPYDKLVNTEYAKKAVEK